MSARPLLEALLQAGLDAVDPARAMERWMPAASERLADRPLVVAAAGKAAGPMARAVSEGQTGLEQVQLYFRYHIESMVGEQGPIAIMSEIPSLKPEHRDEVLELSRKHSTNFEKILERGTSDGTIAPCDVRMTGNAIMGSINWIPKWYHGDEQMAAKIVAEFPQILSRGLAA